MIAVGFIPFSSWHSLCTKAEILLEQNDPGEVIWDEFAVIPFIFLPLSPLFENAGYEETYIWLLVGFVLFRFFDVLKPWIIRSAQSFPADWESC